MYAAGRKLHECPWDSKILLHLRGPHARGSRDRRLVVALSVANPGVRGLANRLDLEPAQDW
jgi:hypothetical protein